MSRRRSAYSVPKLKLRQKTIAAVASIVSIMLGALSAVALVSHATYLAFWKNFLLSRVGWAAVLSPFVFFVAGLVLHKIKWKFAQMNVLLGLVTLMVSLMGLFAVISPDAGGEYGVLIQTELSKLITLPGTVLLLMGVFAIGLVVLLNTSLDTIFGVMGKTGGVAVRGVKATGKVGSVFNRAPGFSRDIGAIKLSGFDDRAKGKVPVKEAPREQVIAETLVQNVAG